MSLVTNAETQTETINNLDASIGRLEDKLSALPSSNPDLLIQVREIVQLPHAAREVVAQQRILRSLDHHESRLRYEVVDKAYQHTFRWIIEDGDGVEAERLTQSRKLLRTWLSEEQGIFHVAGKLGSGKSTLLKFIFNHPNTITDLRKWSGGEALKCV
jgi:type II secretory ATPase GspE/PulE/Tfp pilus assembly ATPase PilB-like protein